VFLRTFFPDAELDRLLRLEARVKNKLAMAAAAVGVAESPIEHGAEGQQSFTDDMEEIERLKNEDATLFERGGTEVSAQTGEEYRQELREAFESGMKKSLEEMPWKSGSGMQKEGIEGFFFCSKIGDTTFLRFVPDSARESADVIQEVGTCLRFIECDQETPKYVTDQRKEAAYHAWTLARESIQEQWDYFTDPKNLQPKVRKLNREINEFLLNHPPADVTQSALENIADKLMSPWPRREENKLRQVWNEEYKSDADKSADLIEAINLTGIQPYEPPERFPRIDSGEIRLVCWLSIQSVG
jgi:hypothetical protein